jgi:three-Cys-motif partner protein
MARRKPPPGPNLFSDPDDPDDGDFFEQPHNWSLEKLQILEDFMWPWSMKLGSWNKHLAYVDAFAGRGEYRDEHGTPGSPLRAVQLAERLQSEGRAQDLRCLFLEKDKQTHAQLASVLEDRPCATVRRGQLRTLQDEVQAFVGKDPALIFLDPFGTKGIEFDLIRTLMSRRNGRGYISTDLLINFSVPGAKRRMGMVHSDASWAVSNFAGLLEVLDDQDHQVASDLLAGISYDGAFRNLLDGYLWKLRESLQAHAYAFPIRRRHDGPVQFYLIIVSRHRDAALLMNQHCHSSAKRIFAGSGHQEKIDFYTEHWERDRTNAADRALPGFLVERLSKATEVGDLMLMVIERFDVGTFAEKHVLRVARQLIQSGQLVRIDPKHVRALNDSRSLTSSDRLVVAGKVLGG